MATLVQSPSGQIVSVTSQQAAELFSQGWVSPTGTPEQIAAAPKVSLEQAQASAGQFVYSPQEQKVYRATPEQAAALFAQGWRTPTQAELMATAEPTEARVFGPGEAYITETGEVALGPRPSPPPLGWQVTVGGKSYQLPGARTRAEAQELAQKLYIPPGARDFTISEYEADIQGALPPDAIVTPGGGPLEAPPRAPSGAPQAWAVGSKQFGSEAEAQDYISSQYAMDVAEGQNIIPPGADYQLAYTAERGYHFATIGQPAEAEDVQAFKALNLVQDPVTGLSYYRSQIEQLHSDPEIALQLFQVGGLQNIEAYRQEVQGRIQQTLQPYAVYDELGSTSPTGYDIQRLASDQLAQGMSPVSVIGQLRDLGYSPFQSEKAVSSAQMEAGRGATIRPAKGFLETTMPMRLQKAGTEARQLIQTLDAWRWELGTAVDDAVPFDLRDNPNLKPVDDLFQFIDDNYLWLGMIPLTAAESSTVAILRTGGRLSANQRRILKNIAKAVDTRVEELKAARLAREAASPQLMRARATRPLRPVQVAERPRLDWSIVDDTLRRQKVKQLESLALQARNKRQLEELLDTVGENIRLQIEGPSAADIARWIAAGKVARPELSSTERALLTRITASAEQGVKMPIAPGAASIDARIAAWIATDVSLRPILVDTRLGQKEIAETIATRLGREPRTSKATAQRLAAKLARQIVTGRQVEAESRPATAAMVVPTSQPVPAPTTAAATTVMPIVAPAPFVTAVPSFAPAPAPAPFPVPVPVEPQAAPVSLVPPGVPPQPSPRPPQVPIPRPTPKPRLWPALPSADGVKMVVDVPPGSIAWRQGVFWRYIPPPWDQEKPLTMPRGTAPAGARLSGITPTETIQVIGQPGAEVPESVSIDMGVADVFISDYGRNIEFQGKGRQTDVGRSLPSPTMGMSTGEGAAEMEEYEDGEEYEDREYPQPAPVPVPVQQEDFEEAETGDSMSDLFEVTNEDIMGAGPEEENERTDIDDLLEVDTEDIMGRPPRPAARRRLIRRTRRPYSPPPSTAGGTRY